MAKKALLKLKNPVPDPFNAPSSEYNLFLCTPSFFDGQTPVFQPSGIFRNVSSNPMIEIGSPYPGINIAVNINNIEGALYDTTDGTLDTALSGYKEQGYIDIS